MFSGKLKHRNHRGESRLIIFALVLSLLISTPALAAAGDGSGGGQGVPLALEGTYLSTVSGETFTDSQALLDGPVPMVRPTIRLSFNKNVISEAVWSNNLDCFTMLDSSGQRVEVNVSRLGPGAQDSPQEHKRNIFISPKTDLIPGNTYQIIVSADVKANNGTSLGAEQKVGFSVSESAVPGTGDPGNDDKPVDEPSKPVVTFTDIAGHWAQQDIELMTVKGITGGVAPGRFNPSGQVTRAQFAAFILRSLGIQESKPQQGRFSDVSSSSWYYGAVETAFANGLVGGYGNGIFKPEANITRQEITAMVTRALAKGGKPVVVANTDTILGRFSDSYRVGSWAKEAVAGAVETGIIAGRDGSLAPEENASRAEAVVMLKRLMEILDKI